MIQANEIIECKEQTLAEGVENAFLRLKKNGSILQMLQPNDAYIQPFG